MVVIELSAIIKLLPGLQFFSHSQLGLIDAQIPVWVRWADFAVGDGKICVKNLSDWSNDFVDGPRPAHTGSVFDEPFSVIRKRRSAGCVKPRAVGGHHHRDVGIQRLF